MFGSSQNSIFGDQSLSPQTINLFGTPTFGMLTPAQRPPNQSTFGYNGMSPPVAYSAHHQSLSQGSSSTSKPPKPKSTWDSTKPGEGLRSLQGWKLIKDTADPPSIELPSMVRTAASYNVKLWETKKLSDFTIVVALKEFQVHKIVLAAQSSVFASMIESDEQVAVSNKLEIKDCSEGVVEEFLCSLYGIAIIVDNYENALELYSLACTFEVEELKLMLEEVLLNNMEDEHAIKALKLGNLHNSEKIIDAAFHHIKRKYPNDIQADVLKNKPDRVEDIVNEINRCKEAIRNLNII